MKVVGLITEYNPFHKGHEYHIKQAKKLTNADYVVVVMSGDFVQRGAPAIMPKHLRTKAALESGASLVIELPVCYATSSAEGFAYGAVSILDKLGCVDAICFGSESGDISSLKQIAEILTTEPKPYIECLQKHLKAGLSYPLARLNAISDFLGSSDFDTLLASPNNILGIEYLKALLTLNSKMEAYTIKRTSSNYHDTELEAEFSSASAVRTSILQNKLCEARASVPPAAYEILETVYGQRYPVVSNDFSLMLKYRLLNESRQTLSQYADVSEELANRIVNQLSNFQDFEQFCNLLKTKEVTYTRISRALLHIMLGLKKSDFLQVSYAHILGFKKSHSGLLSTIKANSSIPLYTKLTGIENDMLSFDIYASNLYESVIADKFKKPFINEFEKQIVIL